MAKRLNPSRRLKAKQAAILRSVVAEHGPKHDDSPLLQRGSVRSSLAPAIVLTAYRAPADNWEGRGRGKRTAQKLFTGSPRTGEIDDYHPDLRVGVSDHKSVKAPSE